MSEVVVVIDNERFDARFETEAAPKTVATIRKMLPYSERIIHVRWSGFGCWIPLGDRDFGIGYENATRHPAPGQFILYPGGKSEAELLFAYGGLSFASKAGPLAGNHFLSIVDGLDRLERIGREVLWNGAKPIRLELSSKG